MNTPISVEHFLALGPVTSYQRIDRGAVFQLGEERLRVDFLEPRLLRLKISRSGVFDETPSFSVVRSEWPDVPVELSEVGGRVVLTTAHMSLVVQLAPFSLAAYRTDGSVLFEDAKDDAERPIGYLHLNDTFVVTRKAAPADSIYGLGQKTGKSDRRGRRFLLWNTDILEPGVLVTHRLWETDVTQHGGSTSFDPYYSSVPFFYHCRAEGDALRGAGFFIDNSYKARFEFDDPEALRYEFQGGQLTEYVFAGPEMPDILSGFSSLTGRMAPPPLWALGMHQCRFHDYDQAGIERLASEYRDLDVPCDVLWLDIHYMDAYRVFTWDAAKFGDVPAFLAGLSARQFRAISIIDPGVKWEPGYSVFDEGCQLGYFCKTEAANLYSGQVWPGRTVFPDFSREEVRAWWGQLNAAHVSLGVAGIWNDMNEPATGGVDPYAMRFDVDGKNVPHERYHNEYALLMAMGTHDGLVQNAPTERPFILTRAGSPGIARYAAQWTGDNESTWAHLAMSIPMSCGMGVSGQPFVGSDVPGFMGRPTAELAIRWTQCGSLTPFFRFHNTFGEPDQYPWSFGGVVLGLVREAVKLRYRLLPYLYTSFFQASQTGVPVQRPLFYEFQHDPLAREVDDAFLLGPALLVAPVIHAGATSREVYLPQGTWLEFYTGRAHAGRQWIQADAPLESIPLFVRGGAILPMYARAPDSTMHHQPEQLDLAVYLPREDGEFSSELREDDGVSTSHRDGAYLRTRFLLIRVGPRVTIRAVTSGDGFPAFCRRSFRLSILGEAHWGVRLNGQLLFPDRGGFVVPNCGEDFELEVRFG